MIKIRNANPRSIFGLTHRTEPSLFNDSKSISYNVSLAEHHDDQCDPDGYRLSGGGMDACEQMPTGSVKAFFDYPKIDCIGSSIKICIGHCQRTIDRE